MRSCSTLIAVLVMSTASAVAQKPAPIAAAAPAPPPLTVQAQVSRTAVWPGDRITYTVEVTCWPGIDILTEDLGRDRVIVEGLELSSAALLRQTHSDGTTVHRATFTMASYSTDTTRLRIAPIRVRYFIRQEGQRVENMTPAGEVVVPAAEIALRSTLPGAGVSGIRDSRAPILLPAFVSFLRPAGLVAIALSLAPVLLGAATFVARRRASRGKRRSRRRPQEYRTALEQIRQLDWSTSAKRVETFNRLDSLLREYLTDLDVPARSLTPDEIQQRLTERHPRMPGDVVASVLRDCQRALYGGPAHLPNADTLQDALDQTGQLLGSRVR